MTDTVRLEPDMHEAIRHLRREGLSPKEISRTLNVPPSIVAGVVRALAREASAGTPAPDDALAGCWVNADWHNKLIVDGHPEWPRGDGASRGCDGLVTVLVAREHRRGKVSVCSFLVDTHCLGVKETIGPRTIRESELELFRNQLFGGYGLPPLAAPLELAQHLVFGAIDHARGLGLEPARDFSRCAGHLGARSGECAIRFGRLGRPMYVAGPYDDVPRIMSTLEQSVGSDNYDFVIGLAG